MFHFTFFFFFSSRRRHTRCGRDWSSDVCSSDLVTKPRELFHDNNFAYVGERDGIHVTLLENNHVLPPGDEQYEAVMVFLIRQGGELDVQVDHHRLGLFSQASWEQAFRDQGLELHQQDLEGIYEPFMIAEGEYPMRLFIGVAPGGGDAET